MKNASTSQLETLHFTHRSGMGPNPQWEGRVPSGLNNVETSIRGLASLFRHQRERVDRGRIESIALFSGAQSCNPCCYGDGDSSTGKGQIEPLQTDQAQSCSSSQVYPLGYF